MAIDRTRFSTRLALIAVVCMLTAGCSTNVSRFQMPGTNLDDVKRLYIEQPNEERHAAELFALVKTDFESRGYEVRNAGSTDLYEAGDFRLSIAADWHWDITWYLTDLRIAIYNLHDGTLVAQSQSSQSSLVRKGLEIIVERAIVELFAESKE